QTMESVFGREFVISMKLAADSEVTGALILRADSATVAEILTVWKRSVKASHTRQIFNGTEYYTSLSNPTLNSQQLYYVILQDIFALSSDEAQIQRIIELSTQTDSPKSLAGNAAFAPALQRRSESEVVSLFINPRAFDGRIQARGDLPLYAESIWNRCRWITLRGLFESRQLKLQLLADYDSQKSPDWWARQVALQGKQALPLNEIPASACLMLSGHVESNSIRDLVKQAAGDPGARPDNVLQIRRVLTGLLRGADPLDDLLPRLGPRWLFYTVPRKHTAPVTFPLDGLIAIELQLQGTAAQKNQIKVGVENALQTGLNALAVIHNAKTTGKLSMLRQRSSTNATVHWAEPVTFFRPAFAVTDRRLIIATDPEVCDAFVVREAMAFRHRSDGRTRQPASDKPSQLALENQLILANSIETRKLLATHSDWFVRQAKQGNISESDAHQRLIELQDALTVIDSVWFSLSGDTHTLTGTIGASLEAE
ncbi:MAG: hypothetical protein VB858_11080, partial [Planctomycetaceae bacterium]